MLGEFTGDDLLTIRAMIKVKGNFEALCMTLDQLIVAMKLS
ncbi:hypothetical protein [Pasteuria penetrans]|nr:hypothetical protein [Pasteuria penetrans]